MLDKGYGYQNISSKKKQCKYDVFNWISSKIHYWLNTQALRIIKTKLILMTLLLSICLGLRQIKLLP